MHVRGGTTPTSILVLAMFLGGCEKVEERTETCGKFTFVVANKAEAARARVAFYEASLRFQGSNFDESNISQFSRFGGGGGQLFVLDWPDDYQNFVEDPPLTFEIKALDTVRNTRSIQTAPCTAAGAARAFDNMKAAISATWKIQVEVESPEYARLRNTTK